MQFGVLRNSVLAVCLMLAWVAAFGQAPVPHSPPTPAPVSAVALKESTPSVNLPAQEIEILKAQLDAQKQFQSDVLQTVYWSLTTVVGVLLLLIGANWWTNYGLAKREHEALSESLKAELQREAGLIDAKVEQANNSMLKLIPNKVEESVAKEMATLSEAIKELKSNHRLFVRETEYAFETHERDRWIARDVPANIVGASTRMLSMAIAMKADWKISDALGFLKEDIELLLARDRAKHMDSEDLRRITEAVDRCPAEYAFSVAVIRELLAKVAKG